MCKICPKPSDRKYCSDCYKKYILKQTLCSKCGNYNKKGDEECYHCANSFPCHDCGVVLVHYRRPYCETCRPLMLMACQNCGQTSSRNFCHDCHHQPCQQCGKQSYGLNPCFECTRFNSGCLVCNQRTYDDNDFCSKCYQERATRIFNKCF